MAGTSYKKHPAFIWYGPLYRHCIKVMSQLDKSKTSTVLRFYCLDKSNLTRRNVLGYAQVLVERRCWEERDVARKKDNAPLK